MYFLFLYKLLSNSFCKHFLYLLFDFGIPRSAFSLPEILRLTHFFKGFDFFPGTLSAKQVQI